MDQAILTAVQYARVPIPLRPRLAPWATTIDLGDDRLQFRAVDFAYTLSHRFFIDTFRAVEHLLDGQRTVEEIAHASGTGLLPTTVEFLLRMLGANGLLQDGATAAALPDDDPRRWERQIRFLAHFGPDAAAMLAVLRRAHVAVLGDEELRGAVIVALEALGIGRVNDITPADGGSRGWARSEESRAVLETADFLVVGLESPGYATFDEVNTVCLELGTRWLRIAVEGVVAVLGPTVIPRQTACFTCYDRRTRSHTPELPGDAAYRDVVSRGAQVDEGSLFPLWSAVAGQAALEVLRILTGIAPPATVGRCYEIGAVSPEAFGHDVLRVPRCPSCGGNVPGRAAWALPDVPGMERP